jgi:hypothetical protein
MTNKEVISNINNLMLIDEKLSGEIHYKISRNKEKLLKEYNEFNKARDETKKSYCELTEDGNVKQILILDEKTGEAKVDATGNKLMQDVFIDEVKEAEWNKVHEAMLNEEIEVDIRTITEEAIFNCNPEKQITTDILLFMIEEMSDNE